MVMGILGIVLTGITAGILIIVVNGAYFLNKFKAYITDIPSKSFFELVKNIYNILPIQDKIIILIQFFSLITITATVAIHSSKKKNKKKPKLEKIICSKNYTKDCSKTDLDILYKMLLKEKEINIGDIATLFKINNDIAIEWCETLENAELATIDYPNFKKPILRLPEEDSEEEEKKTENSDIDASAKKKQIKTPNKHVKKNNSKKTIASRKKKPKKRNQNYTIRGSAKQPKIKSASSKVKKIKVTKKRKMGKNNPPKKTETSKKKKTKKKKK